MIAVTPVLDELPLLKKGGKRVKTKLPDMWKKKPKPKKRYEAKSAPTPKADKTPDAIPSTDPIKSDDKKPPPPPDAAVAKQVDDDIPDTEEEDEPNVDEEGAPDGVEEGTETDPLKARAVSLYRLKLISWLKQGFNPPTNIPCEALTSLAASVSAQIGPDKTVLSYSFNGSGNGAYDASVKNVMESKVGKQVPPPPPNYPDVLPPSLAASFRPSTKDLERCSNSTE